MAGRKMAVCSGKFVMCPRCSKRPEETYTHEKRTRKENYFYVFDGGKEDGSVLW